VLTAHETPATEPPGAEREHVDVLIIGAGLSGVGAACHLRKALPGCSLAILETRAAIGGTWDLFRYPGIRSDSDMFTMGYSFRPWVDPRALADGESIRQYIRETAQEHRVEELIRFGQRVLSASWDSGSATWTVRVERIADGERSELTCGFLYACTGYYRYEEGYRPHFAGEEDYRGEIVHPQHWPEDFDCSDRRVIVIGSGATAVTLVPSLIAGGAEHVTMLQRSPTYIVPVPARDSLAERLTGRLPDGGLARLIRWRNVLRMMLMFQLCRRAPGLMRGFFTRLARNALPAGYDVETHFSPSYNPWDQRVCMAADGDLFEVLSDGGAEIVTAQIERFTERGIRLVGGRELEAEVIVTATGLNLQMLGGIELVIDGAQVELGERIAYKGMMLCGVPNMALTLGYTNASWTLKADLVAEYVCRLLRHMRLTGAPICTPRAPSDGQPGLPILDLKSGYITRSIQEMPKQGARTPWRLHQNYIRDIRTLRHGPLDDEMEFSGVPAPRRPASLAAA
jgi:cation diffusion facilitator CzcD-associated flavoprotein CzcO